jgi:hypothetical protein
MKVTSPSAAATSRTEVVETREKLSLLAWLREHRPARRSTGVVADGGDQGKGGGEVGVVQGKGSGEKMDFIEGASVIVMLLLV